MTVTSLGFGAAALSGDDESTPETAARPGVDESAALTAMRTALPAGWTVTRTVKDSVPDGWVTRDGGGFLVEGENGKKRFRTWFLRRDWIGISPRPQDEVWQRHVFGVLIGDAWKSITLCDDNDFTELLWGKIGLTASLVNSGEYLARKIYGARIAEVDALACALLDQHCTTASDRDGAVTSLLLLGVPAPSVFRKAAAHGNGATAELCASSLCQFPGKESVEVLSRVVGDAASDDTCVKAAAMSLNRLADPASGPSLMMALARVRGSEAAIQVAEALECIRWKEAGALLLRRMREEKNAKYAKPLASLRYEPAIKDIRSMSGDVTFTADWILEVRQKAYLGRVPGIALLRMTGIWGEPVGGVRLALLPPKSAEAGGKVVLALVLENVGDSDVDEIAILEGTRFVNGVALPTVPRSYSGHFTLRPNDVVAFEEDLTKAITEPGSYKVRFEAGKAQSNEIVIEVGAPKADGK